MLVGWENKGVVDDQHFVDRKAVARGVHCWYSIQELELDFEVVVAVELVLELGPLSLHCLVYDGVLLYKS